MKSIKSTVSSLYKLSAIDSPSDGTGLVRQKMPMMARHVSDIAIQAFPPAKALHTALGVLLAVCHSFILTWHFHYDT